MKKHFNFDFDLLNICGCCEKKFGICTCTDKKEFIKVQKEIHEALE